MHKGCIACETSQSAEQLVLVTVGLWDTLGVATEQSQECVWSQQHSGLSVKTCM